MGVTGTHGIPAPAGQQQLQVCWRPAPRSSATRRSIPATWRSTRSRATGAASCQQIGFCFQGCKSGAKWSTLYTEIPKGEATGKLEVRPASQALQIQHDDSGKVTGVLYADKDGKQQVQKARVVAVAGNSIESPRLLLNSASPKYPGRAGQLVGPGRQELHAAHDGIGLRDLRQAGAHVSRHHHGRHHPATKPATSPTAASSAATRWRRCRWACRSWRRSSTPAPGAATSRSAMEGYANMAGMWLVGEDMPQEKNGVTLHADGEGPVRPAGRRTCISTTTPTTSRCASTPSRRAARSTTRSAR